MNLPTKSQSQFEKEAEKRLIIKILYFKKLIDFEEVKNRFLSIGYSKVGATKAAEYLYENRKGLNYRNHFWKETSTDLVDRTVKDFNKNLKARIK